MLTTKEINEANQIIVDGKIIKDEDNPWDVEQPKVDEFEGWEEDELDLLQIHDHMIINNVRKMARKWEDIQGHKITGFKDLCEEGKKEVREFYREFPRDLENIRRIILKRD